MSTTAAKTPGFITVGVASTPIAAENIGRRKLVLVNDHATAVVYVQYATDPDTPPTAVVGSGIRLNAAGGSLEETEFDGAIAAISTVVATNVTLTEF